MSHNYDYHGIYRGIVVDTFDPESLGRVKVQVPQLFGTEPTDWAYPVGGQVGQHAYPYVIMSSSATQMATPGSVIPIVYDMVEDSNGQISADTAYNNGLSGALQASETGDYFMQFSAQFYRSSGSSAVQADIWLQKYDSVSDVWDDLPRTNSRVTLQGNPNETLITLNYVLDLEGGDKVRVVFESSSSTVGIVSRSGLTSPTRPSIPSIITSMNLIGNFTPQIGAGVWVSFEGGNPNFPLWLGTF